MQQVNPYWTSSPGQVQQIQVSSDLIHWTNLPPVYVPAFADSAWPGNDGSLTGGLFNAQQRRYYRLLLPPASGRSPRACPSHYCRPVLALPIHGILATAPPRLPTTPVTLSWRMDIIPSRLWWPMRTAFIPTPPRSRWRHPRKILLTPSVLAALRQKAATNSSQWQTFKSRLDGQLNVVIESGAAYQGDELSWIGDYALGYKALQFKDPVTANRVCRQGTRLDAVRFAGSTKKFGEVRPAIHLTRGDGSTKESFHAPQYQYRTLRASKVYKAPISIVVSVTQHYEYDRFEVD